MTHLQHGWSRIRQTEDDLKLAARRHQAFVARQQGLYQPETLSQFRRVWLQSGRANDWLNYLNFRRSLGYPLTASRAKAISAFLHTPWWRRWKAGIFSAEKRMFSRLLNEYQQQLPRQSPWLNMQLRQQDLLLQHWVERFRCARSIAIVGNSACMAGAGNGKKIDQADLVVRFNYCFSEQTAIADTGRKTDIWVVAPGFRGPKQQAALTILTGPAMLWQQQQLDYLQQLNTPLLHVPLDCWRILVRQFSAPPSAAPLITQLMLSHGVKPSQLFIFGINPTGHSRYHLALPSHQPSSRHHWVAEKQWWQHLRNLGAQ